MHFWEQIMEIRFGNLRFVVNDEGMIGLVEFLGYENDYSDKTLKKFQFPQFDIAGGNLSGSFVQSNSLQTKALRYISHSIEADTLSIVQRNALFEVTSFFKSYDDANALRVSQSFKNISDTEQELITANTLGLRFGKGGIPAEHRDWFFHRFSNARYHESSPCVRSFYDLGFYKSNGYFNMSNNGNVSALYNVPQGIIENRKSSDFYMFQIEAYSSWQAELSAVDGSYDLQLGGANQWYHLWTKRLEPNESYISTPVALCHGKSLNEVIKNMTLYRRHIKADCVADRNLPSIYNEYMHFSWDSPNEKRAMEMASVVASTGCEYYVIDCGWHDSADYGTTEMYRHFGSWYEDRGRFPNGIKAVSDEMHRHGLKFGLWIAPEVVGCKNEKMLAYYDDDCFIKKSGKKVFNGTGYLLNYKNPKVRAYMTETIDRMVNEYGCDYIKFDGCPNPGLVGGELYEYIDAFTDWSYEMTKRHPEVIFEDCAGGGLRTDYKALSIFSLISTSDQIDYREYPYITGNIFASVLPEQAAVWSYPINDETFKNTATEELDGAITKEIVVINMMNAVLGRIHLASRLQLLSAEKMALVKEGVDFYKSITQDKLSSVPYFPKGYAKFADTLVAVGLKCEKAVYLGVWNLHGDRHVQIDLPEIEAKSARVCYPKSLETKYELKNNRLIIDFSEDEQGRIFKIEL